VPPFKAERGPKSINCQQKNAGRNLEAAGDLIEEMGPVCATTPQVQVP
jgi:hypothetical protein